MRKNPKDEVFMEEEELDLSSVKRSKQTLKYIRYLLLLIMVMVALIFLFLYRSEINADNFKRLIAKINIGFSAPSAENGEVYFNAADAGATTVYKDGFAYATVEKLIVTDKSGTEFQNTSLGFRNPVISANSNYIMVYDSGGTGIVVADSFSILKEIHTDMPILSANMNDRGEFVVVTEGDGCLSKVYAYDSSFKEVYRYLSRNRYILDAVVSSGGDAMVASAMNIEGESIVSEILYFELDAEAIQWKAAFADTPCTKLSVKDNGDITALFSWGVASLNDDGKEIGRYTFDDRVLQCYSMEDGDENVFVLSAAENGDGTVVVCDEEGEVEHTFDLGFYAVSLDYKGGRIAVLGNQRCGVYDTDGDELFSATPERASDISLLDKNTIVIVSDTKCVYNSIG